MRAGIGPYTAAFKECDEAYWRALAQDPRVTSYRAAARIAKVAASTVLRKFRRYRLRLHHGRR